MESKSRLGKIGLAAAAFVSGLGAPTDALAVIPDHIAYVRGVAGKEVLVNDSVQGGSFSDVKGPISVAIPLSDAYSGCGEAIISDAYNLNCVLGVTPEQEESGHLDSCNFYYFGAEVLEQTRKGILLKLSDLDDMDVLGFGSEAVCFLVEEYSGVSSYGTDTVYLADMVDGDTHVFRDDLNKVSCEMDPVVASTIGGGVDTADVNVVLSRDFVFSEVDSAHDRGFTIAQGLAYSRDAFVSPVNQGPALELSLGYGLDDLHLKFSGSNKGGIGLMPLDRVGAWAGYKLGDGVLTLMPELGGGMAFEKDTVIGTTWYLAAGLVAEYSGFKEEDFSLLFVLHSGIDRDAKDYPFFYDAMRPWFSAGLAGQFEFGKSTTRNKAKKVAGRDRSDKRLAKNEVFDDGSEDTASDALAFARDVVAAGAVEYVAEDTAEPEAVDEFVEEVEEFGFKALEGVEYFPVGSTEDGYISLPDYVDFSYEKRERSSLSAKQRAELGSFDLKLEEMSKYVATNPKAAEKKYMDIQDLNMEDLWTLVDRGKLFEYYFVGAQSIRAFGDIEEVYIRLQFALQIKPDSIEVLDWMNELDTEWFGVSFEGLDIRMEGGFFASDARAALDFANESLAEEGSFVGYLPMSEEDSDGEYNPYIVTKRGRRGADGEECVLPELPSDL